MPFATDLALHRTCGRSFLFQSPKQNKVNLRLMSNKGQNRVEKKQRKGATLIN